MLMLFMTINIPVKCSQPYLVLTDNRTPLSLASAPVHATSENIVKGRAVFTSAVCNKCALTDEQVIGEPPVLTGCAQHKLIYKDEIVCQSKYNICDSTYVK